MIKKGLAVILALILLFQAIPEAALATVFYGKPLTESELRAFYVLAGLNEEAGNYHSGMALSATMNANQLIGWLDEQMEGDLLSLSRNLSISLASLANLEDGQPEQYQALMAKADSEKRVSRMREMQYAAEDLRETLRFYRDETRESQHIIAEMTKLMASDQVYDYEIARYQARISEAGNRIRSIRGEVMDNNAAWRETTNELLSIMHGTYEGSDALNGAVAGWMDEIHGVTSGRRETTGNAVVTGGKTTLSSRLAAGSSVLDATPSSVTVLGKNTVGIVVKDKAGNPIPGVKVTLYSSYYQQPRSDKTGDEGWVAFNVKDYPSLEDDRISVIIDADSHAIHNEKGYPKYQCRFFSYQTIQKGQKTVITLPLNDEKPFPYSATFDQGDFVSYPLKFYYSRGNDQDMDISVVMENYQQTTPTLYMYYLDAKGDKQEKKADKTSYDKDNARMTFTYTDKWKQILTPDHDDSIYFTVGKETNKTTDGDRFLKGKLTPVASLFDQPTDFGPFLSVPTKGFGLNFTIPVIKRDVSISWTPEFIKNFMPKVCVDISGSVFLAVGYVFDIDSMNERWKNRNYEQYKAFYDQAVKLDSTVTARQKANMCQDYYTNEKLKFLGKGGITFSAYLFGVAKWTEDDRTKDRYQSWRIGIGGNVTVYANFTYQTALGPVPVYADLTISLAIGIALTGDIDVLILANEDKPHKITIGYFDFTISFRLGLAITLGAGVKGVASIWVRGAAYVDISVSIKTPSMIDPPVVVKVGASVSAGLTFLFITVSMDLWKGGPWQVYPHDGIGAYSLLNHYMGATDGDSQDQGDASQMSLAPESYPNLAPEMTLLLSGLDSSTGKVKAETLGDDLYLFYIQDSRVCWYEVKGKQGGALTDLLNDGKARYPAIYNVDELASGFADFDFDVRASVGTLTGDGAARPEDFIALTAVGARSFDDDGYPLETQDNIFVYTLYLWRGTDGGLTVSMNGDGDLPGFFQRAAIGGEDGIIPFIATTPSIQLAECAVTIRSGEGGAGYQLRSAIDIELSKAKKPNEENQQEVLSCLSFTQTGTTVLQGDKPDLSGLTVDNQADAFHNQRVASGAGEGFRRVYHQMGRDRSWLAVSRRDGEGEGDPSAIEFYDPTTMDSADVPASFVVDTGNIRRFTQTEIQLSDGSQARVLFYVHDKGEDTEGSRYVLCSLYLMPVSRTGDASLELDLTRTEYDVNMPTREFRIQTINDQTTYLYWCATASVKDSQGKDKDVYRLYTAMYDPGTNAVSNGAVCSEFELPDATQAVREIYLTQQGDGYVITGTVPDDIDPDVGSEAPVPLSVYAITTTFKPEVSLDAQQFADSLVSPCDFDDYTITLMNSGNMGATSLDVDMMEVTGEGGQQTSTKIGELHADCLNPENSYMKVGDTVVASGEKAFDRVEDYEQTPQRRDWLKNEKNVKYTVADGKYASAEEGEAQIDYIKTNIIMPGAQAVFRSTMQIPEDWDGKYILELAVSKFTSHSNWVGQMARAAGGNTISHSRLSAAANDAGEEIVYERDPASGAMVLKTSGLQGVRTGLYARRIDAPERGQFSILHDLVVTDRIFDGANGEKMLSISITDLSQTEETIQLFAEVYPDDEKEPLRLSLPYFPEAVSFGMTQTIELPLTAVADVDNWQRARVRILGVGIEEPSLANNEFMLYLNGMETDPLTILRQPRDITAFEGDDVSFTVEVGGGMTPYRYQWQEWSEKDRSWTDIEGMVVSFLPMYKVRTQQNGRKVRCVVTDAKNSSVVSDAATLSVFSHVDTGDHSHLPLYMTVAAAALLLIVLLRRREQR